MKGEKRFFVITADDILNNIQQKNLNAFPGVLKFVSKRFIYIKDINKNIKFNDYFEFPLTLNLQRFSTDFEENKKFRIIKILI